MGTHPTSRFLLGTAESPELVLLRRVSAAPAAVREALADPERRGRWLGALDGDPAAAGDAFELRLGDEASDAAVGRLLLLDPEHLATTWSWQGERESVLHARVRPGPDGAGSEIGVRHSLAEPDHVEGYGGGWEQVLQALARELGCEAADAEDDAAIETAAAERWHLMTQRPVEIERVLPASPERVWEALTTREGLASWWWRHWDDVEVELDRERGAARITAPRIATTLDLERLVVERPARLAATWVWSEASGTATDEAIDLRLEEGTSPWTTRLRVRHAGPWAEDSLPENYRQGWESTLGQLAEVLGG
ncbi:SRPBCC domain-containing protein [Brachybacterium sp. ACRRE]|uniref:SRPBCC family protein n=1 Tax=Brachybacterium sp. ACRRE TaxID=2918184 RepID=UPI001EF362C4|nr:SRPBCC family protein [Brachybacterium sp. ACRRE]MCG7310708.1 SRPBCC domain-containing protein [Brachybacterium sp. ACRRE]